MALLQSLVPHFGSLQESCFLQVSDPAVVEVILAPARCNLHQALVVAVSLHLLLQTTQRPDFFAFWPWLEEGAAPLVVLLASAAPQGLSVVSPAVQATARQRDWGDRRSRVAELEGCTQAASPRLWGDSSTAETALVVRRLQTRILVASLRASFLVTEALDISLRRSVVVAVVERATTAEVVAKLGIVQCRQAAAVAAHTSTRRS